MERENLGELGLEFIETCCAAQSQFDAWMDRLPETQLKTHFNSLVEMRTRLNDIVREASVILMQFEELGLRESVRK